MAAADKAAVATAAMDITGRAAAGHPAADQDSFNKGAADRDDTGTTAQQQDANKATSRQFAALRAAAVTAAKGQETQKAAVDKEAAADKAAAPAATRHAPRHHTARLRNLFPFSKNGAGSAVGTALRHSIHRESKLAQRRRQAGEEVAKGAGDAVHQASKNGGSTSDQQKTLKRR